MGTRTVREPTDEEYLELLGLGAVALAEDINSWYSKGAHTHLKLSEGSGQTSTVINGKRLLIIAETTHDIYPDLLIIQILMADGSVIEVGGGERSSYHIGKSPTIEKTVYGNFITGWF